MTTIADLANTAREALASKNNQSATFQTTTRLSGSDLTLTATITPPEDSIRLSLSLAEIVAQKTKDFSDELVDALKAAKIPLDEPFTLSIKNGRVTATGPYKERIEEFFKENPELVEQLKEIEALNVLLAMQEANEKFRKEKEEADAILDKEEREKAQKDATLRHTARLSTISELSGSVTFSDGAFSSAALDYVRSLD